MRGKKTKDDNVNPDFNRPKQDEQLAAKAAKAWLFNYFRQAGELGIYYELYPDDRPVERDPPLPAPRGRGR